MRLTTDVLRGLVGRLSGSGTLDAVVDMDDCGRPGILDGGGMAIEAVDTARLKPVGRPVVVGLLDMITRRRVVRCKRRKRCGEEGKKTGALSLLRRCLHLSPPSGFDSAASVQRR